MKPIAVLYEHPEWFKPLFAELDRLGARYVALHAADHVYDPDDRSHRLVDKHGQWREPAARGMGTSSIVGVEPARERR